MANAAEKVVHHGSLGIVNGSGNVHTVKYFVLKEKFLDYYDTEEDARTGSQLGGHLLLDDIEELDILESGFRMDVAGKGQMELRCQNPQDVKMWVDALTPFFDVSDDEEEEEDVEEAVFHDGELELELNGERRKKYFWLFHDRLEYTNTEEDQVAEDSFPLSTIKAVHVFVDGTGFEVQSGSRSIVLSCGEDESKKWVQELQKAFSAHARERSAKADKPNGIRRLSRDKSASKAGTSDPNMVAPVTTEAVGSGTQMKSNVSASAMESPVAPNPGLALEPQMPSTSSKQRSDNLAPADKPSSTQEQPSEPKLQLQLSSPQVEPQQVLSSPSPSPPMKATAEVMQPAASTGYPSASPKQAEPQAALVSNVQPSSPSNTMPSRSSPRQPRFNGRQPLCNGFLGVLQRGREDKRYFALFEDTFEYWSTQAECERGEQARGTVSNYSIVNLEEAEGRSGYALCFESQNRLELRCQTAQELDMWIAQWNSVLEFRMGENSFSEQPALTSSASIPNFNAGASMSSRGDSTPQGDSSPQFSNFQQRGDSTPQGDSSPQFSNFQQRATENVQRSISPVQRSTSPVPGARQMPNWPDLPGLVFMGSLMIKSNGKMRKRHFALFDNRLDYFEVATDMAAERYPRGRILLRDIQSVDFQDNGFQLIFEDADWPLMALLADRTELPTWEMAWAKAGMPRLGANTAWDDYQEQRDDTIRSASPRPPEARRLPAPMPTIRGALQEGQLGLLRASNSAGRPEPRYFVLFTDRLDCFMDEAMAKKGRTLESVMKTEIKDIDIVDGGFNIISASRSGRPIKLRAMPGILPDAQDWVDAFSKAFAR